jgi:uncharacterized membrane protein
MQIASFFCGAVVMVFFVFVAVFGALFLLHSRITRLEGEVRRLQNLASRGAFVDELKTSAKPPAPVVVVTRESDIPPVPDPVAAPRKPAVAQRLKAKSAAQVSAPVAPLPVPKAPTSKPEPTGPNMIQRIIAGGFEELFGQRLPIWAGGITLAVAGLFMVKYSIDQGLLSPATRIILGLIFSAALVIGAEVSRRWKATSIDPRIPQALAGAGIASAYSAVLVGINVYEIISRVPGFFGLAAITAGALGLAMRFGAPSAVLGLVGGLAAPALIGQAEPNVPGLALYLTLAIGGLTGVARKQRWSWLAIGALAGGFGWGAIMLLSNVWDGVASSALGGYLLVLGLAVPLFGFGKDGGRLLRALPIVFAAIQIAVLVMKGGYGALEWGFYGLLSVGVIILARMDKRLALLPPVAMVVAQATMAAWPDPEFGMLSGVAGGILALFAVPPLLRLWKDHGLIANAVQVSGALIATWLIWSVKLPYEALSHDAQGFVALALAGVAGAVAWQGWNNAERKTDLRFAILVAASAVLTLFAITAILPSIWWGPVIAAVALAVSFVALKSDEKYLRPAVWVGAFIALAALLIQWETLEDVGRVFAVEAAPLDPTAWIRWLAGAGLLAGLRWFESNRAARIIMEGIAALLFGVALAQFVPAEALPLAYAASLLALVEANRRWSDWKPLSSLAVLSLFVAGWLAPPLVLWLAEALESLFGSPMLAANLPSVAETVQRLLLPAAVLGLAVWRMTFATGSKVRAALIAVPALLGAVGAFILFKHVTGLSESNFVSRGFGERVAFTQMLFVAGFACWWFRDRLSALRLAAVALATFALSRTLWFDLIVYNPLWREQAVGAWPVLNLLAPAFLLPVAWIAYAKRQDVRLSGKFSPILAGLNMTLIFAFACMTLRQAFQGSILSGGSLSQAEDIGYSLVAIGLGVGFLRWGIHVRERTWRVASLVLMIGAVGKVFAFDARGLEGLLRIGSFVALGFSLIGIGWLYARYLKSDGEGEGA